MAEPDARPPDALTPLGALVRRHDPDRFLCALFAPAARREALFVLLALNHELARAREAARNPLLAGIRLQWWREVVEGAAAGLPPRQHEVAAPLHAAIAAGALDPAALLGLIDAREAEAEESMPDTTALLAYLRGSAGGLAVAAGRLLGASGPALLALQHAGTAFGLAGVLRSVPALARQGRCLLPEDALAAAGLQAAAVVVAPEAAAVGVVAAGLAPLGLALLQEARLSAVARPALSAALPAVLAARDLRRLAAGRPVPVQRGLADRAAVVWAGLRGRA